MLWAIVQKIKEFYWICYLCDAWCKYVNQLCILNELLTTINHSHSIDYLQICMHACVIPGICGNCAFLHTVWHTILCFYSMTCALALIWISVLGILQCHVITTHAWMNPGSSYADIHCTSRWNLMHWLVAIFFMKKICHE